MQRRGGVLGGDRSRATRHLRKARGQLVGKYKYVITIVRVVNSSEAAGTCLAITVFEVGRHCAGDVRTRAIHRQRHFTGRLHHLVLHLRGQNTRK